MSPTTSKLSPTNEAGSAKKKRKGVLPFGLIVIILSFCCMLSLAVSLLHGSVLHGLPELSAAAVGHPAAAALKSSLLESTTSSAAAVDRGPANGGSRPILASDLRLGQLSCEKHGGPADEYAKEMVYWVCSLTFSRLIPMLPNIHIF